jgi:hypothetical protein
MIRKIRIKEYDVLLENLGPNAGKVIIASPYFNTSHYWGSMGGTLEEFICSINSDYWVGKLRPQSAKDELDVKKTFSALRKSLNECIREESSSFGWWTEPEFQMELRERIRDIENAVDDQYGFVEAIRNLSNYLPYYMISDDGNRRRFESAISNAFLEPWHYLTFKEPWDLKVLVMIHKELKKILEKEIKSLDKV